MLSSIAAASSVDRMWRERRRAADAGTSSPSPAASPGSSGLLAQRWRPDPTSCSRASTSARSARASQPERNRGPRPGRSSSSATPTPNWAGLPTWTRPLHRRRRRPLGLPQAGRGQPRRPQPRHRLRPERRHPLRADRPRHPGRLGSRGPAHHARGLRQPGHGPAAELGSVLVRLRLRPHQGQRALHERRERRGDRLLPPHDLRAQRSGGPTSPPTPRSAPRSVCPTSGPTS